MRYGLSSKSKRVAGFLIRQGDLSADSVGGINEIGGGTSENEFGGLPANNSRSPRESCSHGRQHD